MQGTAAGKPWIVTLIERELEDLEEYHEGLLGEFDARFDLMPVDNQLLALKKENTKLKQEFKKLNGFITQLVEAKKKGIGICASGNRHTA